MLYGPPMSGAFASLKAGVGPLKSRRAMLDTLLRHLDMVRLSAALSLVVLVGCTGLITDPTTGGKPQTPEEKIAMQKWEDKALPVFKANCASCHAGSTPNVGFLVGTTDQAIHDTLLGFDPQVVNIDAPESSRVLTKGSHNGPALLADQASGILEWVQAEHDAAGATGSGVTIIQTAPFTPLLCTMGVAGDPTCPLNHVDLTPVGLPGAEIDFLLQPLSSDSYVTDLVLKAAADGAYIEHPLFVSVPPMGDVQPDSIDRFFNVKMDLMPTTSDAIGGGTAAFVGFTPPTGPLPTGNGYQWYITFKVVDKYRPDTGGGTGGTTGGCKVLDSFKTNVVPIMNATLPGENNNCAACHMGQNGNATSAMNITGIGAGDDPTILTACNQVRTRINFQNIPQSGVLLAPLQGGDGAHPFKLNNFNAFSGPMTTWANAEATAP